MFFWNSLAFFYDPANAGNLISGSSAFSKSSLNIWRFMVRVLLKPGLENFEHYFASVWDEWVQLCGGLHILWHCLSLGLEWKLTFSIVLGWPKCPFQFVSKMVQKNPNEHFGQPKLPQTQPAIITSLFYFQDQLHQDGLPSISRWWKHLLTKQINTFKAGTLIILVAH